MLISILCLPESQQKKKKQLGIDHTQEGMKKVWELFSGKLFAIIHRITTPTLRSDTLSESEAQSNSYQQKKSKQEPSNACLDGTNEKFGAMYSSESCHTSS
jgi:hypothetical protein